MVSGHEIVSLLEFEKLLLTVQICRGNGVLRSYELVPLVLELFLVLAVYESLIKVICATKLGKLSGCNLRGHIWHLVHSCSPEHAVLVVPEEVLSFSVPLLIILNQNGRLWSHLTVL